MLMQETLVSKASSVRRVEVNILLKKERAWMHEEIKKGRKDKTMSRAEAKVLCMLSSLAVSDNYAPRSRWVMNHYSAE